MPQVTLTSTFVRTAVCPHGRAKIDFFDIRQRGFMLEVRQSGGKTFYQRYTDARGQQRQFKVGPVDIISVSQAREKGRSVVAQSLLGSNPQEEREELRLVPTLARFFHDQYLPHVKSYKRSWQTDETVFRIHILPSAGSVSLDQFHHRHVAEILQRMREKGYATGTTNRVLIVLRHAFNLARKWKAHGASNNPTSGLSTAPDVHRERFLALHEIKTLLGSIDVDENHVAAAAIKLLLYTGSRRNEITYAKWEYVDWDKRTLLVPLSKSGRPRFIALNSAAIALLRLFPRLADNPYIFPSPVTGRPSPSLYFPWARIRKRAGLENVRLHDLRHSFASVLVNEGVSLYVVQGLLGHLHSRTTQRYAHLAPSTLLEAAEVMHQTIVNVPADQCEARPVEELVDVSPHPHLTSPANC